MQANAQSPYKFIITLDGDAPEPQGIPIPPRNAAPAVETVTETPATTFAAGMACRTPQGHSVRITKVHMGKTPYGDVYVICNPRIVGPMYLNELAPIATSVTVGDHVRLHIGDRGVPVAATVLAVDGVSAQFEIPSWNEIHWAHTAHVLSVKPRRAAR